MRSSLSNLIIVIYAHDTMNQICSRLQRFCEIIFNQRTRSELKALFDIAWPVAMLSIFEVFLQFITMIFCGHLGKDVLAGISLASSYVNVSAVSVANGLGTAIDTLVSQSFGADKKHRVGVIVQRSLLIFGTVCLPIWGLWLNTENLTRLVVADVESAIIAGRFMDIYLPALPAIFSFTILSKYMENQEVVKPLIFVGLFTSVMSVMYNAVLVYGCGLGLNGAAIAGVMSNFTLALSTLAVIWWWKLHTVTWAGWSKESLLEWGQYYKLALPGLIMYCIEWWTFQVGTFLLAGFGDVVLSTQAIYILVATVIDMIPFGICMAVSVRVGIHLGEGNPDQAKFSTKVGFHLTWTCGLFVAIVMVCTRNVIGYVFTNDTAVVRLFGKVSIIYFGIISTLDWLQIVGQGVVRGCGYQRIGAVVNIITYTVICLPIAICLTFLAKLGLTGYMLGICLGPVLQCICYVSLAYKTDWNAQSKVARKRAGASDIETVPLLNNHLSAKYTDENRLYKAESYRGIRKSKNQLSNSVEVLSVSGSFGTRSRVIPHPMSGNSYTECDTTDLDTEEVETTVISWVVIISRLCNFAVMLSLFLVGLMFRFSMNNSIEPKTNNTYINQTLLF